MVDLSLGNFNYRNFKAEQNTKLADSETDRLSLSNRREIKNKFGERISSKAMGILEGMNEKGQTFSFEGLAKNEDLQLYRNDANELVLLAKDDGVARDNYTLVSGEARTNALGVAVAENVETEIQNFIPTSNTMTAADNLVKQLIGLSGASVKIDADGNNKIDESEIDAFLNRPEIQRMGVTKQFFTQFVDLLGNKDSILTENELTKALNMIKTVHTMGELKGATTLADAKKAYFTAKSFSPINVETFGSSMRTKVEENQSANDYIQTNFKNYTSGNAITRDEIKAEIKTISDTIGISEDDFKLDNDYHFGLLIRKLHNERLDNADYQKTKVYDDITLAWPNAVGAPSIDESANNAKIAQLEAQIAQAETLEKLDELVLLSKQLVPDLKETSLEKAISDKLFGEDGLVTIKDGKVDTTHAMVEATEPQEGKSLVHVKFTDGTTFAQEVTLPQEEVAQDTRKVIGEYRLNEDLSLEKDGQTITPENGIYDLGDKKVRLNATTDGFIEVKVIPESVAVTIPAATSSNPHDAILDDLGSQFLGDEYVPSKENRNRLMVAIDKVAPNLVNIQGPWLISGQTATVDTAKLKDQYTSINTAPIISNTTQETDPLIVLIDSYSGGIGDGIDHSEYAKLFNNEGLFGSDGLLRPKYANYLKGKVGANGSWTKSTRNFESFATQNKDNQTIMAIVKQINPTLATRLANQEVHNSTTENLETVRNPITLDAGDLTLSQDSVKLNVDIFQ